MLKLSYHSHKVLNVFEKSILTQVLELSEYVVLTKNVLLMSTTPSIVV